MNATLDAFAFCADVHLGNMRSYAKPWLGSLNSRAKHSLDSLTWFLGSCVHSKTPVICGDLFDYPNPEAMLLAKVAGIRRMNNSIQLLGNHDQHSKEVGDNALSALRVGRAITEPKVVGERLALVPFEPGVAPAELIERALKGNPIPTTTYSPRFMAIHAGIADAGTPEFMLHKKDEYIQVSDLVDLMEQYDIDTCFAGNWHEPRSWKMNPSGKPRRVIQCGALCPTGFDNEGLLYGLSYTTQRTDKWTRTADAPTMILTRGPRFLTLRQDEPILLRVIEAYSRIVTLDEHCRGLSALSGPHDWPRQSVLALGPKTMYSGLCLSDFASALYVNVKVDPRSSIAKIRSDAEDTINTALSLHPASRRRYNPDGVLEYLSVTPDAKAQERTHEDATRKALHDSRGFRERVETYLDSMEVPEGVDRGVVLGKVMHFLNRGT